MINKYVELHEKFMDLLAKYHNAHVVFINKPNFWNTRDFLGIMMSMSKLIKEIRKNNIAMRKEMQAAIKAKKATKLKEK
jgi:hypothetical protein